MVIRQEHLLNFINNYEKQDLAAQGKKFGRVFCEDYGLNDPDLYASDKIRALFIIRKKYLTS